MVIALWIVAAGAYGSRLFGTAPAMQLRNPSDIGYIAVGDSYTIGTGTTPDKSWPSDLTNDLRRQGVKIELMGNLGVDGYSTQDAINSELPTFESAKPKFASLMIGVNDTYRTTSADTFKTELQQVLDRMQAVMPDKRKIVLLTIPDYAVTPSGQRFAAMNGAAGKIKQFNTIITSEGERRGLPVVDLYSVSQKMGTDSTLRADDNLHPSAKEYKLWEKRIFPAAYGMLAKGK